LLFHVGITKIGAHPIVLLYYHVGMVQTLDASQHYLCISGVSRRLTTNLEAEVFNFLNNDNKISLR
jgi:hypothetical protein